MRGVRVPAETVEQVRRMAAGLAKTPEIAARTGLSDASVNHQIARLRREGKLPRRIGQRGAPHGFRSVSVPAPLLERLQAAAELRGIPTQRLAARLLTVIVEDRMVAAILDDGFGTSPSPHGEPRR